MNEPSCGHSGQPECPGCGQCPDCCPSVECNCPTDDELIEAARGQVDADYVDISDQANVIRGVNGAQVQAWVWIGYDTAYDHTHQYDVNK